MNPDLKRFLLLTLFSTLLSVVATMLVRRWIARHSVSGFVVSVSASVPQDD